MEEQYHVNRTFHLKLTTLSPLAINNGEELSPLSDYFVSNGRLHYVDEVKFQELLLSDETLVDKYTTAVEKTKIISADGFINKLIPQELNRISQPQTLSYKGGKTLQLKRIIKSNGQPFISGSALKGAIKNAVLYYWLSEVSPQAISKFIEDNQRLFEFFVANKESYLKLKSKRNQSLSEDEKSELESLIKTEKNVIKNVDKLLNECEKEAFGILEDKAVLRQPASNLKISDSTGVSFSDNAECGGVKRRTLKVDTKDWVLHTQEYIKSGVTFNTCLQISNAEQDWLKFDKTKGLAQLLINATSNLTPLFKVLNHFSNAVKDIQNVFKLEIPNVKNLKRNEAILFLGSGKGIYRNTVLMAIRKFYEEKGKDFKTVFAPLIYSIKSDSEDFPNSVSHINNYSLGWVRITDINEDAYLEKTDKSYSLSEIYSGDAVEAMLKSIGKPNSTVEIKIAGETKEFFVQGTKSFLKKENHMLNPNTKCIVYWRNNHFNFNE